MFIRLDGVREKDGVVNCSDLGTWLDLDAASNVGIPDEEQIV